MHSVRVSDTTVKGGRGGGGEEEWEKEKVEWRLHSRVYAVNVKNSLTLQEEEVTGLSKGHEIHLKIPLELDETETTPEVDATDAPLPPLLLQGEDPPPANEFFGIKSKGMVQ